jgi:hypothetical protein
MSLTSNKKNASGINNIPIAEVIGGNIDGSLIYLRADETKKQAIQDPPITNISLAASGESHFEQFPNSQTRVVYICGASGAGKSHYSSQYIEKYRELHPDAPFIVFSRLNDDVVIDKLKPKRIMVDNTLITDPIEIESIDKHSIVLFDDCETISDKSILAAVNKIKSQILELGRHQQISIVITSHLIMGSDRNMTKIIMNELHAFVFFPSSGSRYHTSYVLKQYFGLSVKQIKAIYTIESRHITIMKIYPQICMGQYDIKFLSRL